MKGRRIYSPATHSLAILPQGHPPKVHGRGAVPGAVAGGAASEAASFSASAGVSVKPGATDRVARSERNQRPHSTYGAASGSAARVRRRSAIFPKASVAFTNWPSSFSVLPAQITARSSSHSGVFPPAGSGGGTDQR